MTISNPELFKNDQSGHTGGTRRRGGCEGSAHLVKAHSPSYQGVVIEHW